MRLQCIVFLAAAISLVCEGDAVAATYSQEAVVPLFAENTRLLRTHETADEYGEERAITGFNRLTDAVKKGASKLVDNPKVQSLLGNKKSWSSILKATKLDDSAGSILSANGFKTLNSYVEAFNTKNPKHPMSLVRMLTAKYGDDAVARALVQVRRSSSATPDSKEIATKLKLEQLEGWFANKQSVDDVFKLLKLTGDGNQVFRSRKLELLEDYITLFNNRNNAHETLLQAFKNGVGGDLKLATMLQAAKTDEFVFARQMASRLRKEQYKQWVADGLDPTGVMKLLQLDNTLTSPNLNALSSFVTVFNQKQRPADRVTLLQTLTAHYGDARLAKALVSAKRIESTNEIAKKLQVEQLTGWLDSRKPVQEVFGLLNLGKYGEAALASRNLEVLDDYIAMFNTRYSAKESLITALSAGFGGERKLATMLVRGKALRDTKEKATELQIDMFDDWIDRGIKPKNLLKDVLKIDDNALATDFDKAVVMQYKSYYKEEMKVEVL
ncbi:unnamed protein product [Phytophthora lilii]|uniref:Unnamed protein product n=1 Tax=Phytophthora lilii TaxID=2077276 RepID=A0A9W6UA78_9STRA|nr:unnamed protein product [Phytophthora lilii]